MTLTRPIPTLASCAFGIVLACPAMADVTAAELWESWLQIAAAQGQTLSADSVEKTSDGIGLTGVTVVEADETGAMTVRLDQMTLTNVSGAVSVEIPMPQSLTVAVEGPAQENSLAEFGLGGTGLEILVEGTVAAPDYLFSAEQASLELVKLVAEDETVPARAAVAISGAEGALSGWSAAADELALGAFSLASLNFDLEATDPTSGTSVQTAITQKDLKATLEAAPPGRDDGHSKLQVEVGQSEMSSRQVSAEQGETVSAVQQESGRFLLDVADGRASYEAEADSATITFANSRLPTGPVSFAVAQLAAVFSLPLDTSPDPQSAAIALNLQDVTFPEEVWAMIDPALAIPRRPARLLADIEADVLVTDTPPPGLEALADGGANFLPLGFRLREFAFEFAEARLDATGDFTVEAGAANSPIPGSLNPVGQLDVTVTGGLALLQQMVGAGLVQAEQAMGAQMMMGMFATQGDGDTLSSTIVTEPGGGLVVNGTRLR